MPRITATTSVTTLPANTSRRALFLRTSADVYWSWSPSVTTSGATIGVVLKADETLALAGDDMDVAAPIYFITASGTANVDYIEQE